MKRLTAVLAFAVTCMSAHAQFYFQDAVNPEIYRHGNRHASCRKEVVLPGVNGYNVYKADLHTHTVYSDGQVLPKYRVMEAWIDGLDVMAVTEHVEYRPVEKDMVKYLEKYTSKKYPEAVNFNVSGKPATKDGIMVDLNTCVRESQKLAEQYGLTIIPGCEITRDGTTVGHFNALFTIDNNTIYDPDPVQAVRNAKAQNALVMHNHPGWRKKSIDFTETEKTVYEDGLVDGVEVMNGAEFYPGIIDRVQERGLFIAANSDIHSSTSEGYRNTGHIRPMTLILAKDKSLESLREALEADRTLALGFDTVCGEEQLLKDFFAAGMKTEVISVDSKGRATVMLTNCTSVPYYIKVGNGNPRFLDPFSTISLKSEAGAKVLKFQVLNMFSSKDKHPVVEVKF
jgi:hypothetical protein